MPVHVDSFNSDVTVVEGDLPLNEDQMETLVQLVLKRLEEQQCQQERLREATTIRSRLAPSMRFGE